MSWLCHVVDNISNATNVGDMWKVTTSEGEDNWYIVLPSGAIHNIHGKFADGSGWNVSGSAPNFTVSPSIRLFEVKHKDGTLWRQGWHGYLQNGVLTDDLEGRTYEECEK